MKIFVHIPSISVCLSSAALILTTWASPLRADPKEIPNRLIDYDGFLANAREVHGLRAQRRITEDQFIKMSSESDTIIFDARSDDKFQLLHIKGARHLSLPNATVTELAKVIPGKNTRILIYCNNNFEDELPAMASKPTPPSLKEQAMASKAPSASLNIYTFNTLYSYGYKNVYELGPLIDIHHTKLPFEGKEIQSK